MIVYNENNIIGNIYEESDFNILLEVYAKTLQINDLIFSIEDNTRKINLPEVISEGIYSYKFNCVRINSRGSGSCDLIDPQSGERIQVKASTIAEDLSSFGPTSEWDRLIFMDFSIPGEIYIYDLSEIDIYSRVLNVGRQETFSMQQNQGKRPRLSLKKIINDNDIQPLEIIIIEENI